MSDWEVVPSKDSPQAPEWEVVSSGDETPQRTGVGAVAKDVGYSLLSAPNALIKEITGIPHQVSEGYGYAKKHPFKSLVQPTLGLTEGLAAGFSAPLQLARYLAERTGHKNSAFHKTPTPYELLIQGEKYAGIDAQSEGEGAVRGLGQIPLYLGGAKLVEKMINRAMIPASIEGGKGSNPIHAALAQVLAETAFKGGKQVKKKVPEWIEDRADIKKIPELETQAAEAERKQTLRKEDAEAFKEKLYEEYGADSKQTLMGKQRAAATNIRKANEKADGSHDDIVQDPPKDTEISQEILNKFQDQIDAQDTSISPEYLAANLPKHLTEEARPQQEIEEPVQPKSIVPETEASIADSEQKVELIKKSMQKIMKHKKEPGVIASQKIRDDFEKNIKAPASALYDKNIDLLKDETIVMPSELNADSVTRDLEALLNKGTLGTLNASLLKKELAKINKGNEVSAKEFYNAARSTKQTASATRNLAYGHGRTSEDSDSLIDRADILDDKSTEMFNLLEKAPFGEEVLANLKEANHTWATQVKPVESNSLYKKFKGKGKVGGRILEHLSGDETGHDLINQVVSNSPAITNVSFGHSYAEKPEQMLDMTEREDTLLNSSPVLKKLTDSLRSHMGNITSNREVVAQAKLPTSDESIAQEKHKVITQSILDLEEKNKSQARSRAKERDKLIAKEKANKITHDADIAKEKKKAADAIKKEKQKAINAVAKANEDAREKFEKDKATATDKADAIKAKALKDIEGYNAEIEKTKIGIKELEKQRAVHGIGDKEKAAIDKKLSDAKGKQLKYLSMKWKLAKLVIGGSALSSSLGVVKALMS